MREKLDVGTIMLIKARLRDLVRCAGGQDRAGELTGCNRATLSRWGNPDELEWMPTIAAVAILERDTGRPLITSMLAELTAAQPQASAPEPSHATLLTGLITEAADVAALLAAALDDGEVTPTEARRIDDEAAQLVRAIEAIRAMCARSQAMRARAVS